MFLGFATEEMAGIAFGAAIIVFSMWRVYMWVIKPEREMRRQQAWTAIEEMHRRCRQERSQATPKRD